MGENYFGLTDPGRQRTNNEDSFIIQTVFNGHFILACVIDGVGGYEGGEVAAQLTREEIIHELDKPPGNIIDHMISALSNANERIIREKEISPQNEKMACVATLAVVDIESNVFYFAHVGDTRLYLSRDGSLIKVTRDHSNVGFLEESGRLTEEAAMAHPKRNEVNKVLGYERQITLTKDFIDTGESPFLPGDTILLCSDGLTDMITSNKIMSILTLQDDLPAKAQLLINAANDAGGRDNITVALVKNDKSRVQHEVTKPPVTSKKTSPGGDEETKITSKEIIQNSQVVKSNGGKKNKKLQVLFYSILFFIILWAISKMYIKNADTNKVIPTNPLKRRNKQELDFLDSINTSSTRTVRLTGSQPIIITDTIVLKNDTLHIVGNGHSFVRDSAYKGPAFILSAFCKYILLDSLRIENFNVGVLVLNKGLHLKNVQFKNCLVPLQFQQKLAQDSMVSGKQAENIFYFKDSPHKQL